MVTEPYLFFVQTSLEAHMLTRRPNQEELYHTGCTVFYGISIILIRPFHPVLTAADNRKNWPATLGCLPEPDWCGPNRRPAILSHGRLHSQHTAVQPLNNGEYALCDLNLFFDSFITSHSRAIVVKHGPGYRFGYLELLAVKICRKSFDMPSSTVNNSTVI